MKIRKCAVIYVAHILFIYFYWIMLISNIYYASRLNFSEFEDKISIRRLIIDKMISRALSILKYQVTVLSIKRCLNDTLLHISLRNLSLAPNKGEHFSSLKGTLTWSPLKPFYFTDKIFTTNWGKYAEWTQCIQKLIHWTARKIPAGRHSRKHYFILIVCV